MNNYYTSNLFPFVLLVSAFFFLAIIGLLGTIWDGIRNYWQSIFDFGGRNNYDNYGYDRFGRHQTWQNKTKKKCLSHLHKWSFYKKERHNWQMIDGKPFGTRNHIENIIKVTIERPGHTETKLSTLLEWKNRGFNVVYTSWNHWKCNVCGETKQTEFYETPSKEDADKAPPVMNLNDLMKIIDNKKKTQQINTTSYKREIAVEPVKWYR